MHRRWFLSGVGALLAAPAIIRTPGLLMPVKPIALDPDWVVLGGVMPPSGAQFAWHGMLLETNELYRMLCRDMAHA